MNNFYMVIQSNLPPNGHFITSRGIEEDNRYFHDLLPDVADPQMNAENCISILGNMDPNRFMNSFLDTIKNEAQTDCSISIANKELKFNIFFENEEEDNHNKNIEIKLYRSPNGHIIQFIRNGMNVNDFNNHLQNLSVLVRNILQ